MQLCQELRVVYICYNDGNLYGPFALNDHKSDKICSTWLRPLFKVYKLTIVPKEQAQLLKITPQ